VLYAIPARAGYRLRDPDSILHEALASSLAHAPPRHWVAPSWPRGYWRDGPYFEHPACFLWLPALLEKAGFSRGALAANLLYVLALLYLLFRFARDVAGHAAGWLAVASYVASPLCIQQLLRANHEPALAAAVVGAFASLQGRPVARRLAIFAGCAVIACAVKGALGLLLLPAALVSSVARRRPISHFLAASGVAIAIAAVMYEGWFRSVTGTSFLRAYLGSQLTGIREAEQSSGFWNLAVPLYYAVNLFWFALPGIQLFIAAVCCSGERTEAQRVALAAGGTWVGVMALFGRHAARYIFPAYVLCHVPGAEEACRRWPQLPAYLERRAPALPYVLMGLLATIVALRVWLDPRVYRFVSLP
jgi:hypothetical protein